MENDGGSPGPLRAKNGSNPQGTQINNPDRSHKQLLIPPAGALGGKGVSEVGSIYRLLRLVAGVGSLTLWGGDFLPALEGAEGLKLLPNHVHGGTAVFDEAPVVFELDLGVFGGPIHDLAEDAIRPAGSRAAVAPDLVLHFHASDNDQALPVQASGSSEHHVARGLDLDDEHAGPADLCIPFVRGAGVPVDHGDLGSGCGPEGVRAGKTGAVDSHGLGGLGFRRVDKAVPTIELRGLDRSICFSLSRNTGRA